MTEEGARLYHMQGEIKKGPQKLKQPCVYYAPASLSEIMSLPTAQWPSAAPEEAKDSSQIHELFHQDNHLF